MRRFLRGLGIAVLALVVFGVALRLILPVALDRSYYSGPPSGHYANGRFFNPDGTPIVPAGGFSFTRLIRFMARQERAAWPEHVPVTQTRPPARVAGQDMRVTWIGHSTVLVQTQGLNILTDPIWSEHAGLFGRIGPRRVAAPGVRFGDLPKIDLVLVSHNHYDHLDIDTLRKLWARDRPLIVTGLGNDTLLAQHGVTAVARDWGSHVPVRPGIDVILDRVVHWSTRWGYDRNRALWTGFTVTLPGGNLFFAGDTGAGDMRWPAEAAKAGPIRLAIIPIGAYLPREMMAPSHIGPAQAVAVFEKLGARTALGVHWGTFQLSNEAYDAPPRDLAAAAKAQGLAAERFRTTKPGVEWMVPAMAEPASTAPVRVAGAAHRPASPARVRGVTPA